VCFASPDGPHALFGDKTTAERNLFPPSAVVELNRAVAIAMCEGPEQALRLIDALLAGEELANYHLAHSARADLLEYLPQSL
jgi:predicted RNA polymerase sigma factor